LLLSSPIPFFGTLVTGDGLARGFKDFGDHHFNGHAAAQ
jgi:hypothetical protein